MAHNLNTQAYTHPNNNSIDHNNKNNVNMAMTMTAQHPHPTELKRPPFDEQSLANTSSTMNQSYFQFMYGHDKWPQNVEKAFIDALRLIMKSGTSKIKIRNRNYGRNELISLYIKYNTGELRTKKQISSHIQVWKKSILNKTNGKLHLTDLDNEILNLIEHGAVQNEESLKLFYSVFDEIVWSLTKDYYSKMELNENRQHDHLQPSQRQTQAQIQTQPQIHHPFQSPPPPPKVLQQQHSQQSLNVANNNAAFSPLQQQYGKEIPYQQNAVVSGNQPMQQSRAIQYFPASNSPPIKREATTQNYQYVRTNPSLQVDTSSRYIPSYGYETGSYSQRGIPSHTSPLMTNSLPNGGFQVSASTQQHQHWYPTTSEGNKPINEVYSSNTALPQRTEEQNKSPIPVQPSLQSPHAIIINNEYQLPTTTTPRNEQVRLPPVEQNQYLRTTNDLQTQPFQAATSSQHAILPPIQPVNKSPLYQSNQYFAQNELNNNIPPQMSGINSNVSGLTSSIPHSNNFANNTALPNQNAYATTNNKLQGSNQDYSQFHQPEQPVVLLPSLNYPPKKQSPQTFSTQQNQDTSSNIVYLNQARPNYSRY